MDEHTRTALRIVPSISSIPHHSTHLDDCSSDYLRSGRAPSSLFSSLLPEWSFWNSNMTLSSPYNIWMGSHCYYKKVTNPSQAQWHATGFCFPASPAHSYHSTPTPATWAPPVTQTCGAHPALPITGSSPWLEHLPSSSLIRFQLTSHKSGELFWTHPTPFPSCSFVTLLTVFFPSVVWSPDKNQTFVGGFILSSTIIPTILN